MACELTSGYYILILNWILPPLFADLVGRKEMIRWWKIIFWLTTLRWPSHQMMLIQGRLVVAGWDNIISKQITSVHFPVHWAPKWNEIGKGDPNMTPLRFAHFELVHIIAVCRHAFNLQSAITCNLYGDQIVLSQVPLHLLTSRRLKGTL